MKLPDHRHWRRLSPLLDTLLDLDDAGQARLLRTWRQRDAEVAVELERLLRALQAARRTRFLARDADGRAAH